VWSPETLELLCAGAWPAVAEENLGDWRLRAAADRAPAGLTRESDQVRGSSETRVGDRAGNSGQTVPFTGRANSTLAVGDPGRPVAEALRAVCEFAHSHRIPPMVQTVEGSEAEQEIAGAGWVPHAAHPAGHVVSVLTGALDSGTPEVPGVSIAPRPSPGWWELTVGTTRPSPAQRHVLTTGEVGFGTVEASDVTAGRPEAAMAINHGTPPPPKGAGHRRTGRSSARTMGAVRAAVAGDILLVARLAVRPRYRRQGLARALMAACGPWATQRDAKACVLQVSVSNEPALALYRVLGFEEHHRYRYWVPGSACEDRTP
jgi:GNAT superfamily N-acetyltransferase